MFHEKNHLNKHGFFEVGDKKFYSKLDAVQHSVASGDPVSWNFNNEIFAAQNWKVEPQESIRELYRQRAQSIRDRYDYVVVMFSGGADSTTVLDSFLNNGIPVNEILVNHWHKYQKTGPESFMSAEISHAALPYLEKVKGTNTLVRIDDLSDHMLDCIKDPDFRKRSLREVNNIHNPGSISMHHNLHLRQQDYLNLYEQDKSVVFVWGEAKPKISYDEVEEKHYFYFQDHYSHAPQPREQEAMDPCCNHEQFFDDPEHPTIKIKQCHLLLRTLSQIQHRSDIFENLFTGSTVGPRGFDIKDARSSEASTWYNGKHWSLDRNAFNCTIYPDWNFLTFHEDKQSGRLIHPAHAWISEICPKETKYWYAEYIRTYGVLPDEWVKHRGGLEQGIKRLQIKYYLE